MNGAFLKELRSGKKLTQVDLAAYLDVDISLIGKWEIHNITPNSINLIKLSEYFGVSVDRLLGLNHTESALQKSEIQTKFDALSKGGQNKLIGYADGLIRSESEEILQKTAK